ncbi:hypothetical protein [Salinicola salarius]|uniref:hypothetical protein n=1 Tax=Salinicola salarius TaxID=430457 RepID=UPI00350E5177
MAGSAEDHVVAGADALLVVGTSLAVMPAALLLDQAPFEAPCWLVDPHARDLAPPGVSPIAEPASRGVPDLVARWREQGGFAD